MHLVYNLTKKENEPNILAKKIQGMEKSFQLLQENFHFSEEVIEQLHVEVILYGNTIPPCSN